LQAFPQLPISKKVEVLVDKFDAIGVTLAQPMNTPIPFPQPAKDNWVTVSPKKRVKSMVQVRPKRNFGLNPTGKDFLQQNSQPSTSNSLQGSNPTPVGPNDIILANPMVMNSEKDLATKDDLLDALKIGTDNAANMDVFLNIQNFEDVEMSMDSSKRKRIEDVEKASSKVLP